MSMISHNAALKWVVCFGTLIGANVLQAQTIVRSSESPQHAPANPSKQLPQYDVASIKPHAGEDPRTFIGAGDYEFTAQNITLKLMIADSYNIRPYQISGGPSWVDKKRFDVEAKIVNPDAVVMKQLTPDQRRLMLQSLLAERFGLKVHTEAKTFPTYDLVIAKGGPKLKVAAPDAPTRSNRKASEGPNQRGNLMNRPGEVDSMGVPLKLFVMLLAETLQRTVIDKTGLTDNYDFVLKYTPEGNNTGSDDSGIETAPSIFTALQEQLGLKLVPSKGSVDTLVIDHAELPTEN
jgi:uncharacterized protein (TIGR03435 family)